jgi:GAF domain-containing protein
VSSRVFLELLAREAAAVEFEAPLLEARAAGVAPEIMAELERTKVVALRVRGMLERRARREAELSALFDTASDLAGLRDLDAVLRAIVRRARQLLHSDIAYMTLNDDERGDTYMRVTDGSISAEFRRVRLPMGGGLGGLVAQTDTPYATADYFADDRFRHLPDIDSAVREEGLVAILGVPMRLAGRVIGVLFAADRSSRPFASEEVALLGSLAAHAAVAIDNTRLLQETRAALDELSVANSYVRAHSDSVERAARAHDRMADLVVRGGGVEDVAAVVADVLGGALLVLDADRRPLAAVGEIDESAAREVAAATVGRTERRGELWVAPVGAAAEPLGTLVLRTGTELSDVDQRILERAALVTGLLLLVRRSVTAAEARVRGELLDDLIGARVSDPETLRDRAKRLDVDLEAPHVLVVARVAEDLRQRAAFWAAAHVATGRGLVASHGDEVVLLLPGTEPGRLARRLAAELSGSLGGPATAGASGPVSVSGPHPATGPHRFTGPHPATGERPPAGTGVDPARGPAGITAAYAQARSCVRALLALGREGEGASPAELGFVGLLMAGDRNVAGFLETTLGPVTDYDEQRGTALVRTLETYFATGGSLIRAAEGLHIHVNTVSQRLERIGRLLGPDWQRPERALEIQLALRLHRLRGTR